SPWHKVLAWLISCLKMRSIIAVLGAKLKRIHASMCPVLKVMFIYSLVQYMRSAQKPLVSARSPFQSTCSKLSMMRQLKRRGCIGTKIVLIHVWAPPFLMLSLCNAQDYTYLIQNKSNSCEMRFYNLKLAL